MPTGQPLCYVIMPFDPKFAPTFDLIREVAVGLGFRCERADSEGRGVIHRDMIRLTSEATAVVADVSGRNPNVYYELGVAHSLGRKTLVISRDEDLPFDIAAIHVILYQDTFAGARQLSDRLARDLAYLRDGGLVDNPVQMFLPQSPGDRALEELRDRGEEILRAMGESRITELEIMRNGPTAIMLHPKQMAQLEEDIRRIRTAIGTPGGPTSG